MAQYPTPVWGWYDWPTVEDVDFLAWLHQGIANIRQQQNCPEGFCQVVISELRFARHVMRLSIHYNEARITIIK